MSKAKFEAAVDEIIKLHPKYKRDAYFFLRDSLDHTVQTQRSDELVEHRHVTGPEFLDGLRDYSLKEFGPMSLSVLETWGITSGYDVGQMVYYLIEQNVFGRSEEDHPQDFNNWIDFETAFQEPYRPKGQVLAGFDLNGNPDGSNSQQTANSNNN